MPHPRSRFIGLIIAFVLLLSGIPIQAQDELPLSQPRALDWAPPDLGPQGSPVVNLPVPYVHQLWDTPDSFNGNWACGPTSAVMALAHYGKLTPHPITVSSPTSHSNDYGYYVSTVYSAYGATFNRAQYDASRRLAYGGYGASTDAGLAWAWRIQEYLRKHGLNNQYVERSSFDRIKQALDQGFLVILSTRLTGAGHIVLVRGYTDNNLLIVNDPYGNKNGVGGYGKYNGENVQYSWALAQPKWMIIVNGATESPPDNRVLSPSQALNSTIAPATDQDSYTFNGTSGSTVQITMERTSGNLDSYLELYGPSGLLASNDDSSGTQDSRVNATLPANATYRVQARSYNGGSQGNYRIQLTVGPSSGGGGDGDDGRWITVNGSLNGTISPNDDRDTYYINGSAGSVVSIRMTKAAAGLDSYLEVYNPNGVKVAENDDGGGEQNSWVVLRYETSGTFRIVARSYRLLSGGGYTLRVNPIRSNYALNKPAQALSLEHSSLVAQNVTDGNLGTRWSSGSAGYQWIWVDLGQQRTINQVMLRWEAAHATGYGVYGLVNGQWQYAYGTEHGDGDIDVINLGPITTQVVLIQMWGRDMRWNNYSLWEIEVYDTTSVLVPLVPPDDPDKEPETDVVPLVPLAPYPTGKQPQPPMLASDQELVPLGSSDVESPVALTANLADSYLSPTATLTLLTTSVARGQSLNAEASNAHDQDSAQVGSGITNYRWSLAPITPGESGTVVEDIGNQAQMSLDTSSLEIGEYIMMLEVEDDEGTWSEPITRTITITAPSEVQFTTFLPLILQ